MGIDDALAAYCLDGAVTTLGVVIENALAETDEVGSDKDKRRVPRYTLRQLLDPAFVLPRAARDGGGLETLKTARGGFYDEVD